MLHWNAKAKYIDRTEIDKDYPYNAKTYDEECEERHAIECELLEENCHNFGECIWYDIVAIFD